MNAKTIGPKNKGSTHLRPVQTTPLLFPRALIVDAQVLVALTFLAASRSTRPKV